MPEEKKKILIAKKLCWRNTWKNVIQERTQPCCCFRECCANSLIRNGSRREIYNPAGVNNIPMYMLMHWYRKAKKNYMRNYIYLSLKLIFAHREREREIYYLLLGFLEG